jgi:uncharacterized ferredoxin-like protein
MLIKEQEIKEKALDHVAEEMCVAARTAPKAKGVDNIVVAVAKGDTISKLADEMLKLKRDRDAGNIRSCSHVVLIGTKLGVMNLDPCGLCGSPNCASKPASVPCVFNASDLGIAVGSAVSVASDHRVDNRVMYSIGMAAMKLGLLGNDVKIVLGIPLSATGKSPFFDRK